MKYPPLQGPALIFLSISLSLAAFMQILDTSIANVSIPYIAGDLGVSNNEGTWVITLFAVGNAIALPLTGWLSREFGSVRVMVMSTLLFTILSWLCGAAINFNMLLIGRFLQGFVAGPLVPLGQSLILQNYPEEKRNFALSIFLMVIVIGPVVGPVLGGWLTEDYRWNWIFYINVPVGLACTLITWIILHNRESEIVKGKTDWVGIVLLFVGISCLQVLLDKGEQYDWFESPLIMQLGVISLVTLVFLFVWEYFEAKPILELNLLKNRNFGLGTLIISLSYMCIFGAIVITPLWLQAHMGYTSFWAGLAVAPMGILPFFLSIFLDRLIKRFGLKNLILACFVLLCLTFLLFGFFNTDINIEKIALSRLLLGLCLVFWFAPLVSISLLDIPSEKLPSASGLFHFFRIFSGGAGTSLFVYLWDRRAIFHYQRLGESINSFNPNTKAYLDKLRSYNFTDYQSLEILSASADRQAFMLATNDIFLFSAFGSVVLFFVVCFFKRKDPSKEASTAEHGIAH